MKHLKKKFFLNVVALIWKQRSGADLPENKCWAVHNVVAINSVVHQTSQHKCLGWSIDGGLSSVQPETEQNWRETFVSFELRIFVILLFAGFEFYLMCS